MKIEKNFIFVIFSLICLMGHRCPFGFYGYQKFNWMTTLDLVSLYFKPCKNNYSKLQNTFIIITCILSKKIIHENVWNSYVALWSKGVLRIFHRKYQSCCLCKVCNGLFCCIWLANVQIGLSGRQLLAVLESAWLQSVMTVA